MKVQNRAYASQINTLFVSQGSRAHCLINFRLHQKTGDETDAEAEAKAKAQFVRQRFPYHT